MKTLATATAMALTLSVAGLAQAQDISRAQVVRALQQAQAQGRVTVGELPYPNYPETSTAQRENVLQALAIAQASGLVSVGEVASYPALPSGTASAASRTQVLKELRDYLASGEHNVPA